MVRTVLRVLMSICVPVKSDPFACVLFMYNGNVIALDLIGAGVPLAACLILAVYLLLKTGFRARPKRLVVYTVLAVGLGLAAAGEYILWDQVYGGLGISTSLILYSLIIPVGAIAFLILDRERKPTLSIPQMYIVGTTGTVLSDLFRRFSDIVNVSPQIIGAARFLDGVFVDGFFLIVGYLFAAAIYENYFRWKAERDSQSALREPTR